MFDPMHKWLGIAPHDQPPDHYRLLGLTRFESDPDVIDAAADRQMSFLHGMINGPHGKQAEELSNQVSAARLCLLKDDRRGAYDEQLHQAERTESATIDPHSGWLVSHGDGIQHGPFDWSDVEHAAAEGKLSIRTFLFHPTQTGDEWIAASSRLTLANVKSPAARGAVVSKPQNRSPQSQSQSQRVSVRPKLVRPRKRFPWLAVVIPLVALLGLVWILFSGQVFE